MIDKIFQWLLAQFAPYIMKAWKILIRNVRISRKVNKEVAAVREAVENADKALKESEDGDRVPTEEEKKLRQATRRLRNIFD